MNSNQRWTPEEDARLAQLYAEGVRSVDMPPLFGRTCSAIRMRAGVLGVKKPSAHGEKNPLWIAIRTLCADGVPRSVRELTDATGGSYNNIEHLLRVRRDRGLAHVASYRPPAGRGAPRPLWLPIPGDDAERPEPSARAIAQRRQRELPRERTDFTAKRKIAPAPAVIGGTQHELVRALFGMGVAA